MSKMKKSLKIARGVAMWSLMGLMAYDVYLVTDDAIRTRRVKSHVRAKTQALTRTQENRTAIFETYYAQRYALARGYVAECERIDSADIAPNVKKSKRDFLDAKFQARWESLHNETQAKLNQNHQKLTREFAAQDSIIRAICGTHSRVGRMIREY